MRTQNAIQTPQPELDHESVALAPCEDRDMRRLADEPVLERLRAIRATRSYGSTVSPLLASQHLQLLRKLAVSGRFESSGQDGSRDRVGEQLFAQLMGRPLARSASWYVLEPRG